MGIVIMVVATLMIIVYALLQIVTFEELTNEQELYKLMEDNYNEERRRAFRTNEGQGKENSKDV